MLILATLQEASGIGDCSQIMSAPLSPTSTSHFMSPSYGTLNLHSTVLTDDPGAVY